MQNSNYINIHDNIIKSHTNIKSFMTIVINEFMNNNAMYKQFLMNLIDVRQYVYCYEDSSMIPIFDDQIMNDKLIFLFTNSDQFQQDMYFFIKPYFDNNFNIKFNFNKKYLKGQLKSQQFICETLFILQLEHKTNVTDTSYSQQLSLFDHSLLNGMIFDMCIIQSSKIIINIVASPAPLYYQSQTIDKQYKLVCYYNDVTIVNFYINPYTQKLRMSTSSSLNAKMIHHPIIKFKNNKQMKFLNVKLEQMIPFPNVTLQRLQNKLIFTESYVVFTNILNDNRKDNNNILVKQLLWRFDESSKSQFVYMNNEFASQMQKDSIDNNQQIDYSNQIYYNPINCTFIMKPNTNNERYKYEQQIHNKKDGYMMCQQQLRLQKNNDKYFNHNPKQQHSNHNDNNNKKTNTNNNDCRQQGIKQQDKKYNTNYQKDKYQKINGHLQQQEDKQKQNMILKNTKQPIQIQTDQQLSYQQDMDSIMQNLNQTKRIYRKTK